MRKANVGNHRMNLLIKRMKAFTAMVEAGELEWDDEMVQFGLSEIERRAADLKSNKLPLSE